LRVAFGSVTVAGFVVGLLVAGDRGGEPFVGVRAVAGADFVQQPELIWTRTVGHRGRDTLPAVAARSSG